MAMCNFSIYLAIKTVLVPAHGMALANHKTMQEALSMIHQSTHWESEIFT
jgi:hypothetical protein